MEFKEKTQWTALAPCVLAVAQTRIPGEWAAYIAAVPGRRHDMEYNHVLKYGTKLQEDVARALFPTFAELPYSH